MEEQANKSEGQGKGEKNASHVSNNFFRKGAQSLVDRIIEQQSHHFFPDHSCTHLSSSYTFRSRVVIRRSLSPPSIVESLTWTMPNVCGWPSILQVFLPLNVFRWLDLAVVTDVQVSTELFSILNQGHRHDGGVWGDVHESERRLSGTVPSRQQAGSLDGCLCAAHNLLNCIPAAFVHA